MGISTAFSNCICTNIVITGNDFYWNSTNGGGTAYIFLTTIGGQIKIFNNVCRNNYNSYGFLYIQDAAFTTNYITPLEIDVFNNTVFNPNPGFFMRWSSPNSGGDPGLGTIRVANNVFYLYCPNNFNVPFAIEGTSNGPVLCDYNLYWPIESYNQTCVLAWLTTKAIDAQLVNMQTNWGYEMHGAVANPRFANSFFGLGVQSSLNDVSLSAGSPGVGMGTNLGSYFNTDKIGNPRPATGPWDVGAYVFSAPLSPPSNLRITTQ
jgi:hypothetical protein